MDESTISGNSRYINVRLDGDKGEGGGKKGDGKGKSDKGKGYGGGGGKGSFEDRTTWDGDFQTGTVAKWINDRGFGYITPDQGEGDVYVHFSAIKGDGSRS